MVEKTFDGSAFYAALDATRRSRNLSWKQVSEETLVSASTLSRMGQDKRPDADSLAVLAAWSGLNPGKFVDGMPEEVMTSPLAEISQRLYADPNLSPEAAAALDEVIKASYARLAKLRG